MLLSKLGASLLGNMLAGKGINRAWFASKDVLSKGGNKVTRAGYGSKRYLIKDF